MTGSNVSYGTLVDNQELSRGSWLYVPKRSRTLYYRLTWVLQYTYVANMPLLVFFSVAMTALKYQEGAPALANTGPAHFVDAPTSRFLCWPWRSQCVIPPPPQLTFTYHVIYSHSKIDTTVAAFTSTFALATLLRTEWGMGTWVVRFHPSESHSTTAHISSWR